MQKFITVRATREGVRVPREGQPRTYIDRRPRRIVLGPYYRKQIKDGDLEVVEPGGTST